MSKFNGHKNWNHWNVSLWINNDQSLYDMAKSFAIRAVNREQAAASMLNRLANYGTTHTPDGAPYSKTTILAAMRGII